VPRSPRGRARRALLVGGGGARNPAFLRALRASVPGAAVETFDAHGVPAGAAEAIAFALLGRNALLGLPNHLPRTTGARAARVLGEIVPGRNGLRFGS
jgi:anhydro-N-acetylmuramic acid kinase